VLIARTKDMMQGNDVLSSANAVSGYFYDKRSDVVEYFGLRRMNDSLLNENNRLRQGLALYQSYDTLRDKKIVRPFTENDTTHVVHYAQYTYYEARVLSNSISASDNYLTINRGSANGITKNMAVISGTGVVGRVTNVSAHFATVLSILNNNKFRVSSKLKDGTTGSVNWQENGRPEEMFMTGVPQEIKVKKGDSVFTTTYSTLFPRDLLIGTVFKIDIQKKDNSQTLHLHPATNFRNLQYVYVIKDDFINERRQLEDSLKTKKK
jgi:rod shape-determining protein MreC